MLRRTASKRLWIPLRQEADRAGGVAQVEARHDVRVRVVVDDRRVLVGSGDPMDVERVRAVRAVEAQVDPQPRRLDEQLGAFVGEEVDVSGGLQVAAQCEHDGRVDVVLRGARGVVRRCFLAVDRPPREECPDLAHLGRPLFGGAEHRPPEPDHLARRLLVGVGEERHDVHLRVPEVVAVVAAPGDTLRGDALLVRARRRLSELEDVPADRLLRLVVAAQLDVGRRPEAVEELTLFGEECVVAVGLGAAERARAAVGEFLCGHAGGGVVRDEFRDPDRLAHGGAHAEHRLGQVG